MIPKFRGKSIDESNEGKWVYGNLIVDGNNALIVNGIVECEEDYVALGDWCPVDLKTVGQSTGPFDKNGVEIFEGDVVKVDGSKTEVVKFGKIIHEEDFGGFAIYQGYSLMLGGGYPEAVMNEIEVIGNIYELESVEVE